MADHIGGGIGFRTLDPDSYHLLNKLPEHAKELLDRIPWIQIDWPIYKSPRQVTPDELEVLRKNVENTAANLYVDINSEELKIFAITKDNGVTQLVHVPTYPEFVEAYEEVGILLFDWHVWVLEPHSDRELFKMFVVAYLSPGNPPEYSIRDRPLIATSSPTDKTMSIWLKKYSKSRN